jgi:hypothetical protein
MSSEIVNGLWLGKLGDMQLLSINSFLRRGHKYILWVYSGVDNSLIPDNIPDGVTIMDANDILDKKYIFHHWTGNLATFADIFRFKLLYERGGWWVDLDLVCLKKLPNVNFFFGGERTKQTGAYKRAERHMFWIGLMKFPKGDKLLRMLYEDMLQKREDFQDKERGLRFTYGQTKLGEYLRQVHGGDFLYKKNKYNIDLFNPLSYFDMIDFFKKGELKSCCKRWGWGEISIEYILENSYTIHLYNTIIKELSAKRGIKCKLLEVLEVEVKK